MIDMKGITPIITVLLLLLIGVAIIGFAFAFFSNIFQTTTTETKAIVEQQLISMGKNVRIENIYGNNITLRNVGTQDILISDLKFYIENTEVTFSGPSAFPSGQIGNYILNNSQLAMLPDPANLKITTPGLSIEKNVGFYTQHYVAYWKFDEGSGNAVTDSSGNGKNGIIDGAIWANGRFGSAIDFDGINDRVNVSYSDNLNITGPFTIEAWFKVNISARQSIVTRGMAVDNRTNYRLTINSTGYLKFWISNGTIQAIGKTPIALNQWYHVSGTYNGTVMKLFVNGILDDSKNIIGTLITDNSDLYIGGQETGGGFFNGTIDEVRILNIQRT